MDATLTTPAGRVLLAWERQEGEDAYTHLAVAAPPRILLWHDDAHGCGMATTGLGERACPAGPPPPPPRVAWGRLLP